MFNWIDNDKEGFVILFESLNKYCIYVYPDCEDTKRKLNGLYQY